MFGSFPKKLYSRKPLSVVFYVFLSISFHATQNPPDVINAKLHRRVTISRSNRKKCTIFSCKRPEVTGLIVDCFVSWTDKENLPQRLETSSWKRPNKTSSSCHRQASKILWPGSRRESKFFLPPAISCKGHCNFLGKRIAAPFHLSSSRKCHIWPGKLDED